MQTRSRVLIVFGILLLLLGSAFVLWRFSASPVDQAPTDPKTAETIESQDHALTQAAPRAEPSGSRPPEPKAFKPAGKWRPESTDSVGPGQLELRFQDPTTLKFVPRVRFAIFSEHTGKVHGHGIANAQGRAVVHGMPIAKTLIIETYRTGSYTHSLDAVWFSNPKPRSKIVTLRQGGTVFGRAVDEQGNPLSEVQVSLLMPNPGFRRVGLEGLTVAETDARGYFEVDHLTSRGRSVWVIGEEAKVEWFEPAWLLFESEGLLQRVSTHVKEGERVDLGDVVVPAREYIRGQVVDQDDQAFANVLVSLNARRRFALDPGGGASKAGFEALAILPGAPNFRLTNFEALTDADGRFTLELPVDRVFVTFCASSGETTISFLPDEITKPWKFTLPRRRVLEFRFEDQQGTPLLTGPERAPVMARIRFRNGDVFSELLTKDASGVHRLGIELNRMQPEELSLMFQHHEGVRDSIQDWPEPGEVLVYELTPKRRHLLRFRVQHDDREGVLPQSRSFHLCMSPPSMRTDRYPCCGLSVRKQVSAPITDLVKIEVPAQEPYWLEVSSFIEGRGVDRETFGPFVSGPEVHELTLGRVPPIEDQPLPEFPDAPVEEERIPDPTAKLVFDVTIALPGRQPVLVLNHDRRFFDVAKEEVEPLTWRFEVLGPPGVFEARVHVGDHESQQLSLRFVEGAPRTIAPMQLEALPRRTLLLVDSAGEPVADALIQIPGPQGGSAKTDANGLAEFYSQRSGKAPARIRLQRFSHVTEISIDPDSDPSARIVMPEQVRVDVEVAGIPARILASGFHLRMQSLLDPEVIIWSDEISPVGRRVFRFQVSPGAYRVIGGTALFHIDRDIEVSPGEPIQEFEVPIHRRL